VQATDGLQLGDRPFWGVEGLLPLPRADWMPAVDINESDNEFLIKMEIPEVKKDDLKIQVDKGMLYLHLRKAENSKPKSREIKVS